MAHRPPGAIVRGAPRRKALIPTGIPQPYANSVLDSARLVRPGELSEGVVSLGSDVVLEDLDEGTRAEYVLVSSAESNPAEGRISNESPVGRAIAGHHRGDVVDVQTPRRIRRVRIAALRAHR